jgi:hypothetical protein
MRYLVFKNDDASRKRYAMLYLALVNSERRNSREDLRTITDLTHSLRGVGEEAAKLQGVAIYDLKESLPEDGGVVALEGNEFKMLGQLVDTTRWSSGVAPEIVDVMDFLNSAAKDRPRASDTEERPAKDPNELPAEEGQEVPLG